MLCSKTVTTIRYYIYIKKLISKDKIMENYLDELNELVQEVEDVDCNEEWNEEPGDEWGDDFSEL
jgi:hypothetical protein